MGSPKENEYEEQLNDQIENSDWVEENVVTNSLKPDLEQNSLDSDNAENSEADCIASCSKVSMNKNETIKLNTVYIDDFYFSDSEDSDDLEYGACSSGQTIIFGFEDVDYNDMEATKANIITNRGLKGEYFNINNPMDPNEDPDHPDFALKFANSVVEYKKRTQTMDFKEELLEAKRLKLEEENEARNKVRVIEKIQFGDMEIETCYYSPYPYEYGQLKKLFICKFCLKYMFESSYENHCSLCDRTTPPGRKIYKKDNLEVYEVDGAKHKLYCQLISLLGKLFLENKTLFFEMEPFLFYVLCEIDEKGVTHVVGYFSKEKESLDNNLACITILPPYQRKGYGKFLIDLSYKLSQREGIYGSPEKPLSELGKISYSSYWSYIVLKCLAPRTVSTAVSIDRMCEETGLSHADISYTLFHLDLLKYPRGKSIILLKPSHIQEMLALPEHAKPKLLVDESCLDWQPDDQILREAKRRRDVDEPNYILDLLPSFFMK